ncbi:MAG: MglA protein [Deltaproteobacteria bacterium]|nr:MAG: MglA protein [Deltaproteobacteria bacterium]
MVHFNIQQREVTIKIVYYGPALSGKTTNLQAIHHLLVPEIRGRLMVLNTSDDRTLFFDLMPMFFKTKTDRKIKVKLFTAPGQIMHNSTRRIILQGADGVVFVADSQRSLTQANNDSWRGMVNNLKLNGIDADQLPIVIQFNKRDLPDVRSDEEIDEVARRGKEPVYKSVAIKGQGVLETLEGILRLTWRSLDAKYNLGKTMGVDEDELVAKLIRRSELPLPPLTGSQGIIS